MLTAFVVDDEALARRRLASLIADVPWATQVGAAADGAAAIDAIERQRPDVVFLDIQMPEMSGLEVVNRLRTLPQPPTVIFTTAHDQYAVAAFELEALDYLLKPFSAARFRIAFERRDRRALTTSWARSTAPVTCLPRHKKRCSIGSSCVRQTQSCL